MGVDDLNDTIKLAGAPMGTSGIQNFAPDLGKLIPNPATPRSDVVPSRERPEGHYATPRGRTPLMQHLDYFDLNKDGKITIFETWWGLRYLRLAWEPLNTILAFWVALALHLPIFWWTQDSWIPSPLLTIHTRNAARANRFLHPSSSKVLDPQGRFIPQAFEDLWVKYAGGKTRMTPRDVIALVANSATPSNPFGAVLSAFQWGLTLWLFRDDDWCLRKNDVRGLYDGTAFYRLADRNGNPWYGMAARRDAVSHHNMG